MRHYLFFLQCIKKRWNPAKAGTHPLLDNSLKQKQCGAALIMALLIVAITSIIATGLIVSTQNQIQSLVQQQRADSAAWEMTYVPVWVNAQIQTMQKDFLQDKKVPQWPAVLPTFTLANGDQLNASFQPANSRFNINNLGQPISNYLSIFINLLQVVEPALSADDAKQIALNVQVWLLPGQPNQADTSNYFPAHQLMVSASELRLVQGVTADLYQKLQPFIIALPEKNIPIDINTAAPTLLAALLNKDQSAAEAVVQYRQTQGNFPDTQTFLGLPAVASALLQNQNLANAVSAGIPTYFLAQASVQQGTNKISNQVYRLWILQFNAERKTISILQAGQTL